MASGQRLNPGRGREGPLSQSHLKQHLTLRPRFPAFQSNPPLGARPIRAAGPPALSSRLLGLSSATGVSGKGAPPSRPAQATGGELGSRRGRPPQPLLQQHLHSLCSSSGAVGRAPRAPAASARPADREGAPAPSNGLARVPRSGLKTRSTGPAGAAPGGDSARRDPAPLASVSRPSRGSEPQAPEKV